MNNNQSIKQRVYKVAYGVIGSGVLILVSFVTGEFFLKKYTSAADQAFQGLRHINRAESFYFEYLSALRGYMLTPTIQKYKEQKVKANDHAQESMKEAMSFTSDEKLAAEIKEAMSLDEGNEPIEEKIYAAIDSGDRKLMEQIYTEQHVPHFEELIEHVEIARKGFVALRDEAYAQRDRVATINDIWMAFVLIASSVGISIYSIRLARFLSSELEQISTELASSAGVVRTTSQDVSSNSHALTEATTQQAAAIEETVSSMEEMSSMLSQTATNTATTLQLAEDGQKDGERGKTVISKMLSAMDEIHESNSRLESIVNLIEEIKNKTKVINDIVFETRLLSFNASIEAARAGVHGKGFAVVAEEVGKLAAMSGKAAEEIRTLLESSTAEVSSVVRGTQERVNSGREISQECREAFDSVNKSLERISESVRMITAATKEQEQGVRQTNQAMSEMDQVTQKNAAGAESLAQQANQLTSGADVLMGSVEHLRAMIFGGNSQAQPVTRTVASSKFDNHPKESAFEAALPMKAEVKPLRSKFEAKTAVSAVKQENIDRGDSRWKAS